MQHFLSPLGPACQLDPCIQSGNKVGAATLSVGLTAIAASNSLVNHVSLKQPPYGQLRSADNEHVRLMVTRTTCLGCSTESVCQVFDNGHQDSPVERTAIAVDKARVHHKSHTSMQRLLQVHEQPIMPGRQHQAFYTHNVWVNLILIQYEFWWNNQVLGDKSLTRSL